MKRRVSAAIDGFIWTVGALTFLSFGASLLFEPFWVLGLLFGTLGIVIGIPLHVIDVKFLGGPGPGHVSRGSRRSTDRGRQPALPAQPQSSPQTQRRRATQPTGTRVVTTTADTHAHDDRQEYQDNNTNVFVPDDAGPDEDLGWFERD